jgi:adenosine deaminase
MRRSRVAGVPSAGHMALTVLLLLAASGLAAQAAAEVARPEPAASELRAAQKLDVVRADPLALRDFLKAMPKGADLHNHQDGAVYAE